MVDYKELMDKAIEVSKNAYVPYSHFPVGALFLQRQGKRTVDAILRTEAMD